LKFSNFYIETIHKHYNANDPIFFNKADFSWVSDLENNYEKIMECLAPVFLAEFKGLIINTEYSIQFPPKLWKGFVFYFNGILFKKNLKQFPFLAEKLKSIPHLITASVTVLEPGARLIPHTGSTNATMRVHLPLKIPGQYPECGMSIEGQNISWKEGEIFIFCDMKMHSVQNLTSERRYILLLDVIRPEFVHLKKMICVHTIARIITNMFLNIGKAIFN
jgi:aspartyl/asparaginyl beta-hydroxylase (cupin superfamily)